MTLAKVKESFKGAMVSVSPHKSGTIGDGVRILEEGIKAVSSID
jgi:hypothetical protein